jgi:uncharacterized membrane protein YdbT with pleckstrin-like domain
VVISSRSISRKTAIVKRDRIQDVSVSSSLIQQFRDLCSADVYVASGDHGSSFSVEDIELKDGEKYLDAINTSKQVEKRGVEERLTHAILLPGW